VNQLRQLMLEELRRRNFADATIRSYLTQCCPLQPVFRAAARLGWPKRQSQVSGDAVHQVEVKSEHRHPASGVTTLFYIHVLKRGRYSPKRPFRRRCVTFPGYSVRDGLTNWERYPANPIVRATGKGFDADACYKPYALLAGGKWMLWYNGRNVHLEQIGLAIDGGRSLGFSY
jgi:hypothetical protein